MMNREDVLRNFGEVEGLWFKFTGNQEGVEVNLEHINIILLTEEMMKSRINTVSYLDMIHYTDYDYDIYGSIDFYDDIKGAPDGFQLDIYDFFHKVWYELDDNCNHVSYPESSVTSKEFVERMSGTRDKVELLLENMKDNGVHSILFDNDGNMTHVNRWIVEEIEV